MADWDDDNVNDRWPLFYDNYFVPRGYAYILGQMNGTGYTTTAARCTAARATSPARSRSSTGSTAASRATAPRALTAPGEVVANWHNGSSAMIGKSYDGTLANGVAATGVEGLKTIVPVSAISAWYNYSRTGGVRHNTNYPARPERQRHDRSAGRATARREPAEPPAALRRRVATPPHRRRRNDDTGRRRRARRHQPVLARPRLRQGRQQGQGRRLRDPRLPGRQRPHGPHGHVVGGPEGQQRAAQAVAAARRP